jgi:C4-dicarboxylate transporter, DctQ subunit
MRKIVKKVDDILTKIEENLVFLFMLGMLVIVFAAIVNRFILKESLPWADELSRYLMIWSVMIGASLGVKTSIHIGIDAVTNLFAPRGQKVLLIINYVLSFAFCITVLAIGIPFMLTLFETNQLSPSLRIPIYLAYGSVPVGVFFMAIRYFCLAYYEIFVNKLSKRAEAAKEVHAG